MRKLLLAGAAVAAALLFLILLPGGRSLAQQILEVAVNNFPEVQRVEGSVLVPSPIPHSRTIRHLEIVVPPVSRQESTSFIEVEAPLNTAGFTGITLSLQGIVKGSLSEAGQVGAILLPIEDAIRETFREDGLTQLSLEVSAVLARRGIETFSAQQQLPIGFPNYKIYFYNSTDKSVEVNLYAYLTH